MKFSTTLRTSRAQAIIDAAGTNPKMKFYTGTESLTPAGHRHDLPTVTLRR